MANAVAKIPFSGSTQYKGVKVAATATAGTTIHTTGVSASVFDEIYLYLYNGHTADVQVTIEFGGATVPDNTIVLTVPFKSGLVRAIEGTPLVGNGTVGLTMAIFAATANVIVAYGHVNRVTP